VLVGRDALILDEAIGHYLVGTVASLGTRWPAHATSTGKVLLAFATEDVVADFLAEPLVRLTPKTIVDPIQFRRELGRVRDRGHAVTGEEVELGFVAVSVPVLGEGGIAVAALSVGGPKARFPADRTGPLADTLSAAALRIAGRLGYRTAVRPPAAPARGRRG
jgi:DNA-binding IclR family transcriptional regulator